MNQKIKAILEILVIVVLFVLFSYIVQTNMEFFKELMGKSILGMFIYIFIAITAIVIAPVASIPLMPVASSLWGVALASALSVIGWSIGSFIAFIIARKYGVSIMKRLVSLNEINRFEDKIPQENVFWSVVFLRMIIPPDILSYALGLLSKMKTSSYMFATVIGLIPFAIVWAYIGLIPFQFQILVLLIAILILLVGFYIRKKYKK